jgi:hypothetical protein
MAKDVEEYKALRQHIHGQFTLIFQVFTASIVTAIALLGYVLNNILGAIAPSSGISNFVLYLFFPLLPLAIIIPFALLIKALRKEIFKWGSYLEVYLENGKDWKYETELSKYMRRYRERESFNPIAISYFSLSALCFLFSIAIYLYKFPLSFPDLFWLMLVFIFAIIVGCLYKKWWDDFKDIPVKARQEYINKWEKTKKDGENTQGQSAKESLFNRGDRDKIIALLNEINDKLAYQKKELAHHWISSFGLAVFALGIAFIDISMALPTAQSIEKHGFKLV